MCTLVISREPHEMWPIIVGANRDEMMDRPWSAPARHWDDRPEVVAGKDILAGGSWMGINDTGVVAAILNRMGTLGPMAGKRSRGELILEALDHADAVDAASALGYLDGSAYRPFNMVIADNRDAFWVKATGQGRVQVAAIPEGVHMISALDLDDQSSPRIAAYLPRFKAAPRPIPEHDSWEAWQSLMSHGGDPGSTTEEQPAMCFQRPDGFGTVSSSLVALPAIGSERKAIWKFAAGRPDLTPYAPIRLEG